ncbi:MAG: hypothetical protein A2085_06750 [Gemmatimonadetes bacterium GWC2_71_10]|nr:MAG: hypothetical protein A2085_06750 [Gemmatimonadetes bacterium GWC2_71_10]
MRREHHGLDRAGHALPHRRRHHEIQAEVGDLPQHRVARRAAAPERRVDQRARADVRGVLVGAIGAGPPDARGVGDVDVVGAELFLERAGLVDECAGLAAAEVGDVVGILHRGREPARQLPLLGQQEGAHHLAGVAELALQRGVGGLPRAQ